MAKQTALPDWPWRGLLLSGIYLILVFSLPCLGGRNCNQATATRQGYNQSREALVVLCTEAKCTVTKEQTKEDQANTCHGAVCWGWGAGHRYLGLIWDDPVALFTALLFISTGLLWWVTRNTWKHAQESSEYQLRAYVGIAKRLVQKHEIDGLITCTVTVKNFGQTPANNMRASWFAWLDTYPDQTKPFNPVFNPEDSFSLAPSDEFNLMRVIRLRDADAVSIVRNNSAIWAKGIIEYQDVFGHTRKTPFNAFFTGRNIKTEPQRMHIHGQGNHSD